MAIKYDFHLESVLVFGAYILLKARIDWTIHMVNHAPKLP